MAVSQQIPIVTYIANGKTNKFPITFDLHDEAYLVVTINKEVPVVGACSVIDNDVVFRAAPNDGDEVTLARDTVRDRETNFKSYNNSFRPEALNYDLDKIWHFLQEQNLIDAAALAQMKNEIEWRRTNDFNYDELSKARDAQVFSGLKRYIDTFIGATNPDIFSGVTAGIVFAIDKQSVQTHLENISVQLEEDQLEIKNKADLNDVNIALLNKTNNSETLKLDAKKADLQYVQYEIKETNSKIKAAEKGMLLFSFEVDLLKVEPVDEPTAAKAFDTRKEWIWETRSNESKPSWHDNGPSDLDQANSYTDQKIAEKFGDTGGVSNLFDFEDVAGEKVILFREDGDIVNPDFSMNEIGKMTNELDEKVGNKLESINEQNSSKSLHEFGDVNCNVVVSFEQDGDVIFNGGKSLKNELHKLNVSHFVKSTLNTKDFLEDDYIKLVNQASTLNSETQVKVFSSASKQNYSIKNVNDFLALKIEQHASNIEIDTPYYDSSLNQSPHSQVVHPYLCEFKNKPFGFKYILLLTPFHFTNDQFENPCVYGSNDLKEFEMLSAFEQPLAKPLNIEYYNYNSDNFAVFDHTTSEFCVFYRNTVLVKSAEVVQVNDLYVRKTSDFIMWSNPVAVVDSQKNRLSGEVLSPSVIYNTALQKWMMHYVDFEEDSNNTAFFYRTSDSLESGWSDRIKLNLPVHIKPWHQEVRFSGTHFICIINDISSKNTHGGEGNLFVGISTDGINWQFSQSIFSSEFLDPYKATISPEIHGNKVFFNILWTSNGNKTSEGWKLFAAKTNQIEVI